MTDPWGAPHGAPQGGQPVGGQPVGGQPVGGQPVGGQPDAVPVYPQQHAQPGQPYAQQPAPGPALSGACPGANAAAAPWGGVPGAVVPGGAAAGYPTGPSSTAQKNPAGVASLILGVIGAALGSIPVLLYVATARSSDADAWDTYLAVSRAISIALTVLGLAGTVLGALALARRGAPKAVAGVGLGLSAAGLIGIMGYWLQIAALG